MANMLTGTFVGHFPIADAHSPTNPTWSNFAID